MKQSNREPLPVIGKIGSFEVTDYKGHPIINIDGTGFGIRKVKSILANSDACKAFLAKYDVAKETPATVDAESLVKQNLELQAELAAIKARLTAKTPTRFSPENQNAVAA